MKRIGLVTLAMVLALGSLGIAYAAWTDEITIQGTVETGTVDLDVVDVSGTYIYKYLGDTPWDEFNEDPAILPDALVRWQGWMGDDPYAGMPTIFLPVASAWAGCPLATPDEPNGDFVMVKFNNLFPCQDFTADFMLHYNGSIPVKLYAECLSYEASEALAAAIASGAVSVTFAANEATWVPDDDAYPDGPGHWVIGDAVDIGHQMHFCEFLRVAMTIHLPQDNSLMNQSGSFKAKIWAVQWNQYDWWLEGEPAIT